MMETFLIFIGFCAVGTFASPANWTGLTVKFGLFSLLAKNNLWFFNVPTYIGEEVESGEWVSTDIDNLYDLQALSFKVDYDYGFNPLYDQNGFIAGGHVCQSADRTSLPPNYDSTSTGTVEKKTIGEAEHLCSSFLLVSPETLKSGGRSELGSTIGEGIWLRDTTNPDTGYVKIPDDIDTLLAETAYEWENCVANMGTHYFYNTTEAMDCYDSYNWFLLADRPGNTINGLGFYLYGSITNYNTDFYDYITGTLLRQVTPTVNDCFFEWTDTYGLASIHIYFTNNPENIACGSGDSVTD